MARGPSFGARIVIQIGIWREAGAGGDLRDASGGFRLEDPDGPVDPERAVGAVRIPDVSWMTQEQFDSLSTYERKHGLPSLCPALVVEIISPSETVASQRRRMDEWMRFGARLGWLIDPLRELVWIYRAEGSSRKCWSAPRPSRGRRPARFHARLRAALGLAAPTHRALLACSSAPTRANLRTARTKRRTPLTFGSALRP